MKKFFLIIILCITLLNPALGLNYYETYIPVTVTVLFGGDVNHDCIVNIFDLIEVATVFGTHEGDTGWNPDADLNNDGKINIFDLVIVARNFGNEC